ncbi:MAG: histone deacetylase family protein, partial [Acetobacteraceae bacterium]
MRAFSHPDQMRHTPRFFLQRGQLRPNFEVPERAALQE